jgi:chromosome segregation ATPase
LLILLKRLLHHLTESGNYSNKDLTQVQETLRQYKETVAHNGSTHDLHIVSLIDDKIKACDEELKPLQETIDKISPRLVDVHERLVSLRRCIKAAEAKKKVRHPRRGYDAYF